MLLVLMTGPDSLFEAPSYLALVVISAGKSFRAGQTCYFTQKLIEDNYCCSSIVDSSDVEELLLEDAT